MIRLRPVIDRGNPLLGCWINYPAPGIIECLGKDWDWFWLDGQHGQLAYNELLALVRACDLVNKPSLIRVPSHDRGMISMALDTAPSGIIVPQVETVEQAREIVKAARFPPLGDRSYGGRRLIDLEGRGYSDTVNEDTLLVLQLESSEALKKADQIALIPGVDVLNLGSIDLMLGLGCSINDKRPFETVADEYQALVSACKNQGKYSLALGYEEEVMRLCVSIGIDLILVAGDAIILAENSRELARTKRKIAQDSD